ncbi:MAG: tetrahydrofolate dehydrogenase/cyclohydrolase catalytic domain-containing protein, partial [Pseudomonadota bacterium]|nr:tetrahydrofolate dehydrogenase/cyclohydrolase catalytic domain-containing protein [Pseudomonadota bacterium]
MTDATLIDGKAFSEKLVERVAERAAELSAIIGRPPALAVVLVGDNAASAVYVRN